MPGKTQDDYACRYGVFTPAWRSRQPCAARQAGSCLRIRKGGTGSCLAASREAKACGIKVGSAPGMPAPLPSGTRPPHMQHIDTSCRSRPSCSSLRTASFPIPSTNSFLIRAGCEGLWGNLQAARRIIACIREQTGLTAASASVKSPAG